MKRFITLRKAIFALFVLSLCSISSLFAQAPQGINYQAVLRDDTGNPIDDTTITVTVTISSDVGLTVIDYSEEFPSVTTNDLGLFTLVIGSGNATQGSFPNISWGSGSKYLTVEIGSISLGTTQLMSVPYALYAETSGDTGTTTAIDSVTFDQTSFLLTVYSGGDSSQVDLSALVGTDTAVVSGSIVGTNLQLLNNQGQSFNIDIGALVNDTSDSNERISSFQVNGSNLEIIEGGTLFQVDLNALFSDTNIVSGALNGTVLELQNNQSGTIFIDLSGLEESDSNIVSGALNGTDLDLTMDGGNVITIDLSSIVGDTFITGGSISGSDLILTDNNGGTVTISLGDLTNDTIATNELITNAVLNGQSLEITDNGNTWTIDFSQFEESDSNIVSGALNGTDLDLTMDGGNVITIDLSSIVGDTFITGGSIIGSDLVLTDNNSGTVTIPLGDLTNDTTATNELITNAVLNGQSLEITDNGNTWTIDFSQFEESDSNIVSGALNGTDLDLTMDGGNVITIDLSSIVGDTFITGGSIIGNDLVLTDNNSGTVTIPLGDLTNDTSATNELITSGALNGTDLEITDAGGTTTVDLSTLADDVVDSVYANAAGDTIFVETNSGISAYALSGGDTNALSEVLEKGNNANADSIFNLQYLQVNDSLYAQNGLFNRIDLQSIYHDGFPNQYIRFVGNNDLQIQAEDFVNVNSSRNINLQINTNTRLLVTDSGVAIGNSDPQALLDVDGRAQIDTLEIGSGVYQFPAVGPTLPGQVIIYNGTSLVWDTVSGSSSVPPLNFVLAAGSDAGNDTIHSLSRLGIGNNNPAFPLDVSGIANIWDTTYIGFPSGEGQLNVQSATEGKNIGIYVQSDNAATDTSFAIVSEPADYGSTEYSFYGRNGVLFNQDEVGIGTDNPDSMLTVAGGIHADAIRLTDGASLGYVLTSAADGSAFWAPTASGSVDTVASLTLSGTTLIITSGDLDTVNQNLSSLIDSVVSVSLVGTELVITSSDGDTVNQDLSALINDADADATNELITGGALNGTDLEITDAGGTTTVDLSSLANDVIDSVYVNAAGDSVYVLTNTGLTGYQLSTGSASIDTVSNAVMIGDSLAIASGDNDTVFVDLNQFVNSLDNDTSATNELISGGALNGTDLEITDAGGTTTVDLSSLANDVIDSVYVNAAGDSVYVLTNTGLTGYQLSTGSASIDTVSNAVMIGDSLAIASGDNDTVFVDLNQFVNNLDNDTSATNELISGGALNGTDLEITDAGGTTTVDLSSLANDVIDSVYVNAAGDSVYVLTNTGLTGYQLSTGSPSIDTVSNAVMIGDSLAIASGDNDTVFVDLNQFVNNLDNDTSATNELISGGALNGTDLEITDAGGTTTVDLSSLANDEIDSVYVNAAGDSVYVLTNTGLTGYQLSTGSASIDTVSNAVMIGDSLAIASGDNDTVFVDLNQFVNNLDNDTSATNELISGGALNGTDLEITDAGGTTTVDLSSLANDEIDSVYVNAAGDSVYVLTNTGLTGYQLSTGSASIDTVSNAVMIGDSLAIASGDNDTVFVDLNQFVNNLDNDTSATNELISGGALNGTDLEITDAGGTTTVDLSSLANDVIDSVYVNAAGDSVYVLTNTGLTGYQLSTGSPSIDTVSNAVMIGDSLAIASGDNDTVFVDLNQFVNNLDNDTSATNELISGATLNGNILQITDAGGTTVVDLSSLVDSVASLDLIGTELIIVSSEGDTVNQDLSALLTGDTLGNHQMSQNLVTNGFNISNDGDSEGLSIAANGQVSAFPATTGAGNIALLTGGDIRTQGQGTGIFFSNTAINVTGNDGNLGGLHLRTGSTTRVSISSTGVVTINSPGGGNSLDVVGQAHVDSLNINGAYLLPYTAPSLGDVITYDGTNVIWGPASTSADTVSSALMIGDSLAIASGDNDTVFVDLNQFVNNIDNDTSATNELITGATLNGNNLQITDAGGTTVVDLSSLVDSVASLDLVGTELIIVSSEGDTVNQDLSALLSTPDIAAVLAAGNDAGGDSIMNLQLLQGDTVDVQYGQIARVDGDTLNMNFGSITTVSAQRVVSDSILVDSLFVLGYKFPDPIAANPGEVLTYNGAALEWDSAVSATYNIAEVLAVGNDAGGDSILNLLFLQGDTIVLGNPTATPGYLLDVWGRGWIDTLQSYVAEIDTIYSNELWSDTAILTAIYNDGLYSDSIFTDQIEFGTWTGSDPWRIDGNSPASNGDVLTYQNGYGVWASGGAASSDTDWDTTSTGSTVFSLNKNLYLGDSVEQAGTYGGQITSYGDATDSIGVASYLFGAPASPQTFGNLIFNFQDGAAADQRYGIWSASWGSGAQNIGVYGSANNGSMNIGVHGVATVVTDPYNIGVRAEAGGADTNIALMATSSSFGPTDSSIAVYASVSGSGARYSGFFDNGDVFIRDSVKIGGSTAAARRLDVVGDAFIDSIWTDSLVIGNGPNQFAIRGSSGSDGDVLTLQSGEAVWQPGGSSNIWDTISNTVYMPTYKRLALFSDTAQSEIQVGDFNHIFQYNDGSDSGLIYTMNINDQLQYTLDGPATVMTMIQSGFEVYSSPSELAGTLFDPTATGTQRLNVNPSGVAINGDNADGAFEVNTTSDSLAITIYNGSGSLGAPVIELTDEDGGESIGFQAADTLLANYKLVLPDTAPLDNQVMAYNDTRGRLEWRNAGVTDTTCPSGFTKVNNQFCIELTARSGDDWFDAADTCAFYDAKLPTWSEWYTGTQVTGVDWDGTNAWEWIDQASQNNASIVGGGSGASTAEERKTVAADDPDSPSNTVQYRCVYRLRD